MTSHHRVHQPMRWLHIEAPDLREGLEANSRKQVGFYVVSSGLRMEEADFLGAPLAVLAVVDDFGNLQRVQA